MQLIDCYRICRKCVIFICFVDEHVPSVLLDGAESKTTVNATVYEHQHGTCDGDCLYVHRNDMLGARNVQRPLSAVQVFTEYPCRYADRGCKKVTLQMYNTAQHECSCKFKHVPPVHSKV